jgi:hypothetical protein
VTDDDVNDDEADYVSESDSDFEDDEDLCFENATVTDDDIRRTDMSKSRHWCVAHVTLMLL